MPPFPGPREMLCCTRYPVKTFTWPLSILVGRETSRTRLGVRRIWRNPGSSFRNSAAISNRSEEHTSELQSRGHLVCRLLLEKKKKTNVFVITKNNSNEKGINSMSDLGAK